MGTPLPIFFTIKNLIMKLQLKDISLDTFKQIILLAFEGNVVDCELLDETIKKTEIVSYDHTDKYQRLEMYIEEAYTTFVIHENGYVFYEIDDSKYMVKNILEINKILTPFICD